MNRSEELVRELGDRIGYGRIMQLCEKIWSEKQPGGAHSVGPCVGFMVPCPHLEVDGGNCVWCCGSGRVTARVLEAQKGAAK